MAKSRLIYRSRLKFVFVLGDSRTVRYFQSVPFVLTLVQYVDTLVSHYAGDLFGHYSEVHLDNVSGQILGSHKLRPYDYRP
jgi:hypothetical protein